MFDSSVCSPKYVLRPYVCAKMESVEKFLGQLPWNDGCHGPVTGATVIVERVLDQQNACVETMFSSRGEVNHSYGTSNYAFIPHYSNYSALVQIGGPGYTPDNSAHGWLSSAMVLCCG